MSYRLQKDEPLIDGIKRVAQELAAGAVEDLKARKVYETRKAIKKLRAILRLLRPYLGAAYKEENRRLRDIGRRFSGLRDLDVSLELLESFSPHYKRKESLNPHRKTLAAKRAALEEQHSDLSDACEALLATGRRIENWHLQGLTRPVLEEQIKKTHRKSGHAYHRARKTRTAEDFHEFRKLSKHELNQVRLLNNHRSAQLERLKELSTLLGDHHNVVILCSHLENASARLRRLAGHRMRELEEKILAVAAQLYDAPATVQAA